MFIESLLILNYFPKILHYFETSPIYTDINSLLIYSKLFNSSSYIGLFF